MPFFWTAAGCSRCSWQRQRRCFGARPAAELAAIADACGTCDVACYKTTQLPTSPTPALHDMSTVANCNFSVAVRVRPDDTSLKSCVKIAGNTICVAEERHGREAEKSFAFDTVFGESTKQEEVFAQVAGTVDAVPDGFHGCIFAYGPTGSGELIPSVLLQFAMFMLPFDCLIKNTKRSNDLCR